MYGGRSGRIASLQHTRQNQFWGISITLTLIHSQLDTHLLESHGNLFPKHVFFNRQLKTGKYLLYYPFYRKKNSTSRRIYNHLRQLKLTPFAGQPCIRLCNSWSFVSSLLELQLILLQVHHVKDGLPSNCYIVCYKKVNCYNDTKYFGFVY